MADFNGFSEALVEFFNHLEKNNTKIWFDKHRNEYEKHVKQISRDFVVAMGEKLQEIAPRINAVPKINQSLFRINRDTRFSRDKRPYKTNLGIWFWEGRRKRMACSGFYFHYGDGRLMLGTGIYLFPRELIETYRAAVIDKKLGPQLTKAVNGILKQGYDIGVKHYKRIPRGYDTKQARADFLLHNGLTASIEKKVPRAFFSGAIVNYAYGHYKKMAPIHRWLVKALG